MAETGMQGQGTLMDEASQQVAENLADPLGAEGLPQEGAESVVVDPATEIHHADPAALGLNATAWVSLAMLVLLIFALWKKIPSVLGRSLDQRIAAIRAQLAEAEAIRREAEALRDSYAKKLNEADVEAAAIRKAAQDEAAQLIEKSRSDSEALIARRQKMAEDKIAAAERGAVAELRRKAASAATAAAQALIAEKHQADSDAQLVDSAIAKLN